MLLDFQTRISTQVIGSEITRKMYLRRVAYRVYWARIYPTVIQSFAYRVPRIDFCLPVEFLVGNAVLFGHTRNVSVKGFLVEFDEPVLQGTLGRIRFRIGRCMLELDTRVAHSQGLAAGMEFAFASDEERFGLVTILQVITNERASQAPHH